MSLEMDLDLTGIDLEQEDLGGPGLLPGWYPCQVTDSYEDHNNAGTLILEFTVTGGPSKGRKITERLFSPANAADEEKAKVALRRLGLFALRLGLVTREASNKQVRPDWSKALGRLCVIKVIKRKGTDKHGNEREFTNLDFAGVFDPSDDRVPEELRTKPAGGSGGGTTGAGAGANPPTTPPAGAGAGQTVGAGAGAGAVTGATAGIDYSTL